MSTETSSDYAYPLITPSYLVGYHRCDQAKDLDIWKRKENYFVNLRAMKLVVIRFLKKDTEGFFVIFQTDGLLEKALHLWRSSLLL